MSELTAFEVTSGNSPTTDVVPTLPSLLIPSLFQFDPSPVSEIHHYSPSFVLIPSLIIGFSSSSVVSSGRGGIFSSPSVEGGALKENTKN